MERVRADFHHRGREGQKREGSSMTRREFLATGAAAVVASAVRALPGDRMRYAMSGHQFRTTPPHPEAGIRMTAQYGYHGLEPFQEDVAKYLERRPQDLK